MTRWCALSLSKVLEDIKNDHPNLKTLSFFAIEYEDIQLKLHTFMNKNEMKDPVWVIILWFYFFLTKLKEQKKMSFTQIRLIFYIHRRNYSMYKKHLNSINVGNDGTYVDYYIACHYLTWIAHEILAEKAYERLR